ncbi:MAG: DUF5069 domain-containing protein [Candidatus Latescibacterota bacterium]|jgi:hypothetical protein
MDLTKQPPRRPSNANMAGIVGLARMTDKGRGHNAETIGLYLYGADSKLDTSILQFVHMGFEEFADAADAMSDDDLSALVLEKAQRSEAEIEAFNHKNLTREPEDDSHRQILKERLAKYAPERTDIKTIFSSIELDDWGDFRDVDLTQRPPRSPYWRSVFGVMGAARMADKGRAAKIGKLGEYKYGEDSGLDRAILAFLGVGADEFVQAAYANPNDRELSEWIGERVQKTPPEICAFNASRAQFGRFGEVRERFMVRRAAVCGENTSAIDTFFDLIDYEDELSFGIVDLTRRAPRSIYDTSVGGVAGLARAIDKARAYNSDLLGEYWYGEDSGVDRGVLIFVGAKPGGFAEALKENGGDEEALAWLGEGLRTKAPEEIEKFNHDLWTMGPRNDHQWAFVRNVVGSLDPQRQDICCFAAMTVLDDKVYFARFKAGV